MGSNNESSRSHRQVTAGESIYRKLANKITLVAQTVKNLPAVQETWVQSLGWGDLLKKEMATHSSVLS